MPQEITASSLNFTYDAKTDLARKALIDVSIRISLDGIVVLTGKTGSGKSTLAQNLDGLLIPDSGVISYPGGIVIDRSPIVKKNGKTKLRPKKKIKEWKTIRQMVGIVFQFPEDQLFKESVLADVMVGPLNFGMTQEQAKAQAIEALKEVGLDPSFFSRSPFELSGGEKRRVALAGVLAFRPKLLILDEPTVGLDPVSAKRIMADILTKNQSGTGVAIITHDMDLAYAVSDRIVAMAEGKIVFDGRPENLFQNEALMAKASLEPPAAFRYAKALRKAGYAIDWAKAKTPEGLAEEIRRNRKR